MERNAVQVKTKLQRASIVMTQSFN